MSNLQLCFARIYAKPVSYTHLLMPCVAAIGALVEQFGATAVLCTATQPVLGDFIQRFAPSHAVSEICPEIPFYFDKFRRVTFRQVDVLEDDVLAEPVSYTHLDVYKRQDTM